MNHRVSSIRNLRTIKALRGESIRIDLGKTFEGTLQSWMKRLPNSPTHREFTIVNNRYLTLSSDSTKDFFTTSGVLVESVKGKWYFDVEQTTPEKGTKTIFTGTIYFEEDVTGSNSVVLGGEVEPNTVEFLKTTSQEDPNNSLEADEFVLNNEGKQLFWQVEIPETETNEAINEQYWYSYKTGSWINLIQGLENANKVNLSFDEEELNYTFFGEKVYGVFLEIEPLDILTENSITVHNLNIKKYLKAEILLNRADVNTRFGKIREIQFGEFLVNSIENPNAINEDIDYDNDLYYIEYTKNDITNTPQSIFNEQFNNFFS